MLYKYIQIGKGLSFNLKPPTGQTVASTRTYNTIVNIVYRFKKLNNYVYKISIGYKVLEKILDDASFKYSIDDITKYDMNLTDTFMVNELEEYLCNSNFAVSLFSNDGTGCVTDDEDELIYSSISNIIKCLRTIQSPTGLLLASKSEAAKCISFHHNSDYNRFSLNNDLEQLLNIVK
jgi:hypothetical protein